MDISLPFLPLSPSLPPSFPIPSSLCPPPFLPLTPSLSPLRPSPFSLPQVVYQLANDEGNFAIDAVGNITLVASLDREVTAVYNLTIMALDRGQPQMTATEYLIVTVGDINDETPEFSQVCCCVLYYMCDT